MGSAPTPSPAAGSGLQSNMASMLCYIPICLIGLIIAIVFLVMDPYNKNKTVRFNAFQSIFLHIALIAIGIAWQIFVGIMVAMTHGFAVLLFPLGLLLGLGIFVLMLYMCFQAYNGKEVKLPVIGDLAAKQA
jgi:uncharacterized membrane protein